ncbi:tetratricopeptide repeat protein [Variovorax saccharolyticus]|uniref:tetratricopeptide repeat protein n=1 Tax=Variovorax saccharolyticus TaxID=3053516 RepID=UPI00257652BA|nr:tetratricopeptide repeat protein [Variovorax sp. J22R187]MDM0019867.1 tetratricopeptide repeat protein [Variovorax sp. J22R187]
MIDITLENFQSELIDGSMTTPVLLDIWAEWCGPCKQLGPVLEKLEVEYAGRFTLAKLDADKVPQISEQLSQMFGVRSIPFCVMFKDGQPVDGFVGAIPADQIRTFLDKHVPPGDDENAPPLDEEVSAQQALAEGDTEGALEKLQHAVATDPANDDARFDYVKLLLQEGRTDDAEVAFAPVIAKTSLVRRFDSLQRWMDAIDFAAPPTGAAPALADLDARIAANKRDFEARFDRARLLMSDRRWTDAMDELLDILMRDKSWNEDLARKTYIAVLDIIEPPRVKVADGQIPPDDPTVASYRRRLSSVVLS